MGELVGSSVGLGEGLVVEGEAVVGTAVGCCEMVGAAEVGDTDGVPVKDVGVKEGALVGDVDGDDVVVGAANTKVLDTLVLP